MPHPEIPRHKFPWYPTINYGVCTMDLQCLNFCPYEVYEWDPETGRPLVAHPNRCVPGCDACAQDCRRGAISFPTPEEFRATMRQLRAEVRAGARE